MNFPQIGARLLQRNGAAKLGELRRHAVGDRLAVIGEACHLLSHDAEAGPVLNGTRRLDAGIEGEQTQGLKRRADVDGRSIDLVEPAKAA
jgi:hypothetical protein